MIVTTAGPSIGAKIKGITKIMITGTILTGTFAASSSFFLYARIILVLLIIWELCGFWILMKMTTFEV